MSCENGGRSGPCPYEGQKLGRVYEIRESTIPKERRERERGGRRRYQEGGCTGETVTQGGTRCQYRHVGEKE